MSKPGWKYKNRLRKVAKRSGHHCSGDAGGERLKEESRQEATKQAQTIVDRTRTELEAERDKIVGDLRREFVDISISAAEKVIKETLDKEKHRKLIEETLRESVTLKKSKVKQNV
jgi:flagellar biosynthesis/type III secretory pathway protein FliH